MEGQAGPEGPVEPAGRGKGADADALWRHARAVSSCVTVMTALYFLVVAFDNLTNPASNWEFVKGVLSGDGMAEGNGFEWREIHATWFAAVVYAVVIAGETAAGVLLLHGGACGLLRRARSAAWERAQRTVLAGGVVGLLIFFLGFVVIGGNWFAMYLNDKWNGMDPAFQNTVVVLFTLVLSLLVSAGGRLATSPSVPGRTR
ncbi:DUF2165 domain-containing protein [Streptomyces axinellae]|uniref:DUF2165 domain-containing protein n=1 Tax=Streptomyces axinellae TaxID=552788 RepID=A0ABN3Q1Y1_9ACTN